MENNPYQPTTPQTEVPPTVVDTTVPQNTTEMAPPQGFQTQNTNVPPQPQQPYQPQQMNVPPQPFQPQQINVPPQPQFQSNSFTPAASSAGGSLFSFGSPMLGLIMSVIGLVVGLSFLTILSGASVWLSTSVMIVLSSVAIFFSVLAHKKSPQSTMTTTGLILAIVLLIGSVFAGGTSVYYYLKLKSISDGFQNSTIQLDSSNTGGTSLDYKVR